MLTDEQLAEIEKRQKTVEQTLAYATQGPVTINHLTVTTSDQQDAFYIALQRPYQSDDLPFVEVCRGWFPNSGDAHLMAAAYTDMQALSADIAALLEEVRQRREADVDPMIAVKAYEAAHGGRSFTFRRGSNIFSHSGATAEEAWANAGMPAGEFGSWSWYEIQIAEVEGRLCTKPKGTHW